MRIIRSKHQPNQYQYIQSK